MQIVMVVKDGERHSAFLKPQLLLHSSPSFLSTAFRKALPGQLLPAVSNGACPPPAMPPYWLATRCPFIQASNSPHWCQQSVPNVTEWKKKKTTAVKLMTNGGGKENKTKLARGEIQLRPLCTTLRPGRSPLFSPSRLARSTLASLGHSCFHWPQTAQAVFFLLFVSPESVCVRRNF